MPYNGFYGSPSLTQFAFFISLITTAFRLTSTVHTHNPLIYKGTQKYLGTTNAQIFKDYVNQYSG